MKADFSTWRKTSLACSLGFLAATFGAAAPSFAVDNTGVFELDGNAVDGPAAGIDWSSAASNGGVFTGILTDPGRASGGNNVNDDSIFTGGGSKDVNDVSQWRYTSGTTPDKNDITNAYAFAHNNGDLVIYFGADRFAQNGDAQIGFWFFQQDVRMGAGGKFTNGPGGPVATHTDGDILILADFTQGGTVGTVKVYKWVGGADGYLDVNPLFSGVDCNGSGGTLCAIENKDPETAPWAYTPKSGVSGTFPQGAFFEGGINVTALFGGSVPCFASFLAETRSSQSPTAQLKDLVLGGFPVCGVDIGKACATGITNPVFDADTNMVHTVFNVPIENTGLGTVYDVTIEEASTVFSDTVLDKPGSQCSLTAIDGVSVGPTTLLSWNGTTATTTAVKVADSLTSGTVLNVTVECDSSRSQLSNTISVKAKSSASGTTFNIPLATHTTTEAEQCGLSLQSGLTVDKTCTSVSMVGGVVPQVCVDITVTNTSQQDVTVTSLVDVESNGQVVNVLAAFEAANGNSAVLQQAGADNDADTVTFNRCYTPTATGSDPLNPALVSYPDQVTATAVGVFDGALIPPVGDPAISATASCPLCPQPSD